MEEDKKVSFLFRIPGKLLDFMVKGLLLLILLIIMIFIIDIFNYRIDLGNAEELKVGDTMEQVTEIMGKPTMQYPKRKEGYSGWFSFDHETWVYGKSFSGNNSFPLRFRFNPAPDDIVVVFDDNGKAIEISRP